MLHTVEELIERLSLMKDKAIELHRIRNQYSELSGKQYDKILAQAILDHAKHNDVLVHQDPELFKRLSHLEQGQSIPPNLYVVIAELIAFSYVLRGEFPDSWK